MLKYPYILPELPYPYDSLEPYIDTETMHYHHDKHFQTYIDNLNKLLEPYPMLQEVPLETLLAYPNRLPFKDRVAIMNNAGGVYNHNLFFMSLTPDKTKTIPDAETAKKIIDNFGSFEEFKNKFNESAKGVFGSGWTYLAESRNNNLQIINFANQDTPLYMRVKPIILVDVWEHAYYLKYKNARADYLNNIWNVLKWQ